jgi:hypothetical protein
VAFAAQGRMTGAAGQVPAFHDGDLFAVKLKGMPDSASGSLIGKNRSINVIYAPNGLDEEQDFAPVIDAIQGDSSGASTANSVPRWK